MRVECGCGAQWVAWGQSIAEVAVCPACSHAWNLACFFVQGSVIYIVTCVLLPCILLPAVYLSTGNQAQPANVRALRLYASTQQAHAQWHANHAPEKNRSSIVVLSFAATAAHPEAQHTLTAICLRVLGLQGLWQIRNFAVGKMDLTPEFLCVIDGVVGQVCVQLWEVPRPQRGWQPDIVACAQNDSLRNARPSRHPHTSRPSDTHTSHPAPLLVCAACACRVSARSGTLPCCTRETSW